MPIEFHTIEIVFRGVEQKADDRTRRPDMLTRAINVEFDKDGILNKRLGYQYVDVSDDVAQPYGADDVMLHLAQRRDELLIVTYDSIAALGSKDAALRGAEAIVYRGPNNRGHVKLRAISVSTASTSLQQEPP